MPVCEHTTTEFMMRRDGVDYVRCLQCDSVFEAEDLEQTNTDYEDDEEADAGKGQHRKNPS
jgi:hypothetical protein